MTTSTPHRRSRRPWLVCHDLQREYVVPGRPRFGASSGAVASTCNRFLQRARASGWRVVHCHRAPSPDACFEGLFGAPIEGLQPRITEPLFLRQGLSAFSNPSFAAEMREARDDDVYLIGFSLADTCLATSLGAVDAGVSIILVEDALGVSGVTPLAAAQITRALLRPLVRTVSSRGADGRALELAR